MSGLGSPRAWLLRLVGLVRRNGDETRMREEMQFHLDQLTARYRRQGLPTEEARRRALLDFGGRTRFEEAARDAQRSRWLSDLLLDLRYAGRALGQAPTFALLAVLTLAFGVGANTAIFSVVHAVLLKPFPYPRPDQLQNIFQAKPQEGIAATGWSYVNFTALRERTHSFTALAGSQRHQLALSGRGDPRLVAASVVTGDLFDLFQVPPLLGRVFHADDDQPGAAPVVMLSEGLWRSTLAADSGVIGKPISLDQRLFTVIGVMPARFRFPAITEPSQVWVPLHQDPLFGSWVERRGGHWLQVSGRLKPGVTPAQVEADLAAVGASLAADDPESNAGWEVRMVPLQELFVGELRPAILAVFAGVTLLLLIACGNLTSLLLARGMARGREIAVRTALGASRGRLFRQLLAEAAMLGALGGVAGVLVAHGGVRLLDPALPATLPRINPITVDYTVLGFALLVSLGAGLLVGVLPAVLLVSGNVQSGLRGATLTSDTGTARRVRRLVVAGQVALAMILLVAGALFFQSYRRLNQTSPGFTAPQLIKADVSLPRFQYASRAQWIGFSDRLLELLHTEPDFRHSALAVPVPVVDGAVNLGFLVPETGREASGDYVAVSPEYFQVMEIPLMRGRSFGAQDAAGTPPVTVVSEGLARTVFPGQDPIGHRLRFAFPPDSGVEREIIGVVGDVRDVAPGQAPRPMMYVPFNQAPFPGGGVVVRSPLDVETVGAGLRRVVKQLDPGLPVSGVSSMPEVMATALAQPRLRTQLVGLFAIAALLLAAGGIFGVISYSVSRRLGEIGLRVALGASQGAIRRLVLGEAVLLTAVGLGAGVPAAIGAGYLIRHLLFAVSPADPLVLLATALMLALVALLAAYLPVRQALRVDPMRALRAE
jgi:putative ABC transport system permease protein